MNPLPCSRCEGTGVAIAWCEIAGLSDRRCCSCPEGQLLFAKIDAIISRNCLAAVVPESRKTQRNSKGAMASARR
jgi:hypothetical protein